jgi:hypothetical protein
MISDFQKITIRPTRQARMRDRSSTSPLTRLRSFPAFK